MSARLVGEERDDMRKRVVGLYPPRGTKSIRGIAAEIDRSYGVVWNLLEEAGLVRHRGKRRKSASGNQEQPATVHLPSENS